MDFFLFCFWFWPFFRLLIVANHNNKKGNNTNNAEKEGFWNNVDPYFFSLKKIRRKEKLEIKKLQKEVTLEGFDCELK
jgi:hypothetical protein